MNVNAMTTNDACTFASAVFIVAGLTPMFLPTMTVAANCRCFGGVELGFGCVN